MKTPEFITDDTTVELAQSLSGDVAGMLREAIEERGRATLVVSGGSTPLPFFKALRSEVLDWQRVTVTLADERWVKPDHNDSNERFVREHLLTGNAALASFCPLYEPGATTKLEEAACHERIRDMGLPFDVVVLGMGEDGHTASLFPLAAGLPQALDLESDALCRIIKPPEAPHLRMTLSLKALLSCRHLLLHITGERKRQVLQHALNSEDVLAAPVAALFLQKDRAVSVYWAAG